MFAPKPIDATIAAAFTSPLALPEDADDDEPCAVLEDATLLLRLWDPAVEEPVIALRFDDPAPLEEETPALLR